MKIAAVLVFIAGALIQNEALAQARSKFDFPILQLTADLNNDGRADKVEVTQDTAQATAPYLLEIFFRQTDGSWKLVAGSAKIILPEYPYGRGGFISGNRFLDVTIHNGLLSVNHQLLRGHFEHQFRFYHGSFELVRYTEESADGHGTGTAIEFNLISGLRKVVETNYENDKVISRKRERLKLRPLPRFEEVVPFDAEYY
ncbi:MAG: hypothetical protein U0T73_07375 [Chitinophagales bacterium]